MSFIVLIVILILNYSNGDYFIENYIIGGNSVSIANFPYQVSLRLRGGHFCSGAIISSRHIVTAAHCILCCARAPYSDFIVVTGTSYRFSGGQSHRVLTAIPYFSYSMDSASSENDIGIITLVGEIKFNPFQYSIRLPDSDIKGGELATISGWGYTNYETQTYPNKLQFAYINLLTNDQCQWYYNPQTYDYKILPQQICGLKQIGIGTCSGDSGGPVVSNNKLVGIVSWSIPCAVGYPSVFTKVFTFKSYIYWLTGVY